jgi:hypothetical protein
MKPFALNKILESIAFWNLWSKVYGTASLPIPDDNSDNIYISTMSTVSIFLKTFPRNVITGVSFEATARDSLPVLFSAPHIAIHVSGMVSRLLLAKFTSCIRGEKVKK